MSFFGHSKWKPIDYFAFFKHKNHSAALTAIIASSNVLKTKNKASNAYSTSVKNTSNEVSDKIAAANELNESEPNYDVMPIDQ